MKEETVIRATNGVAVGGLTLPAWWPTLEQTSQFAGAIVPILSAIWLILQIYRHFTTKGKPPHA